LGQESMLVSPEEIRVYGSLSAEGRWHILHAISTQGPLSLKELSKKVGLKEITIRHHVRILEHAGLIKSFDAGKGVPGRPERLYKIVDKHIALGFPKRQYELLSRHLMESLVAREGREGAVSVLMRVGQELGKKLLEEISIRHGVKQLDVNGFCRYILPELESMGSSPTVVSKSNEEIVVKVSNCVFWELAKAYPGVICEGHKAFFRVMAEALGNFKSELKECMAEGHDSCIQSLKEVKRT